MKDTADFFGPDNIFDNSIPESEKRETMFWNRIAESINGSMRGSWDGALEELVVHGQTFNNGKEGGEKLFLKPDLDGRASIFLLEEAGVKYKKLTFVPKGESVVGSINIDTGERDGFVIEDDYTVYFDHHGEKKGRLTSSTEIVYNKLVEMGFLKKEKWIDDLVDFVTGIDNLDYPISDEERRSCNRSDKDYFKNEWWRSLYGLADKLPFEEIIKAIKAGVRPDEPFDSNYARDKMFEISVGKEVSLFDLCEAQHRSVINSERGITSCIKIMKEEGVREETEELGYVLLNVINKTTEEGQKQKNIIPLGFTAVRAESFDSYIIWNENTESFFITSKKDLETTFDKISKKFPRAKIIRGTMIVNPPVKAGDVAFSPRELLRVLSM